jgi:sugar phosphate isomerase/epimerase
LQIGVCVKPGVVTEKVAGLDFLESTIKDLLVPTEDEESFQQKLAIARSDAHPTVAANCLFPKELKTTGPEVNRRALKEYFTTTCRRAAAAGIEILVFGSGGSRNLDEGVSEATASAQMIEGLQQFGPIAAAEGITLVLEPLNRNGCNFINSVDEAAALVRAAGHPAVRVLADTFHMAKEGEEAESIRRAGELVAHVHCAEGDGRGPLGTVGEDHRPYFKALKDIGYDGRVSIEAKWTDLAAQLPAAIAELNKQIEEA